MPLPQLPFGYQQSAYDSLIRHLPRKWFHQLEDQVSPLYPVLWGAALALAYVRLSYDNALRAAIPMLSAGPWLSLHLQGIGLTRRSTETDTQAKDRYQWEFKPTRNTRAGQIAALQHYLGLEPPAIRLEGDRSLGRYGQFRIVLEDQTQPWDELSYEFIGELIRRYVANGITPSLDIKLQCLLYQPLPAWQFSDQLPMGFNVQGPAWERPAFISPLRLPFARNLITQVSAVEWRAERDRLTQLFTDGLSDAPGTILLYLSDEGSCPYLLVDYDLELTTEDIEQTFPPRPWDVDGWHFYDGFAAIGPSSAVGFFAPYLEVSPGPVVDPFPPLPLQELFELYPPFPGSQTLESEVLRYRGLDFTRFQVTRFYDVAPINTGGGFTSAKLEAMRAGPWELKLTEGDERWGSFPPQGSTLSGTVFQTLKPSSIWWTDISGNLRSFTALFDGEAVYLAIEFLLPQGTERNIRELELTLDGDRIEYRRFSLPITETIDTGFIFRVRGSGVDVASTGGENLPSGLATGLTSAWYFNNSLNAAVGGNNLTLAAGTTQYTVGQVGQAIAFDGSTHYSAPSSESLQLGNSSYTIAFVLKYQGNGNLAGKWSDTGNVEYQLRLSSNEGVITLDYRVLNTSFSLALGNSVDLLNKKYLVLAWRDSANSINGLAVREIASGSTETTNTSDLGLRSPDSSPFKIGGDDFLLEGGWIDALYIWKGRVLSSGDRSDLYDAIAG